MTQNLANLLLPTIQSSTSHYNFHTVKNKAGRCQPGHENPQLGFTAAIRTTDLPTALLLGRAGKHPATLTSAWKGHSTPTDHSLLSADTVSLIHVQTQQPLWFFRWTTVFTKTKQLWKHFQFWSLLTILQFLFLTWVISTLSIQYLCILHRGKKGSHKHNEKMRVTKDRWKTDSSDYKTYLGVAFPKVLKVQSRDKDIL